MTEVSPETPAITPLALWGLKKWKEGYGLGTVLESTICHYCGTTGKMTQDHIVPRSGLPPGIEQPYWFRSNNIVPACMACNNIKGCLRSDCECDHCRWAWASAKALWNIEAPPGVKIVRSP